MAVSNLRQPAVLRPPALIGGWLLLLGLTFTAPALVPTSDPGDFFVRNTARVALLFWLIGVVMMLRLGPGDWTADTARGRAARWAWTLGWAGFVIHVATAFHYAHGWSHDRAFDHTRAVSGVGEGIFVSHLFTLLWTLDVAFWWLAPARYAARPAWVGWALHGFMGFIVFNGTVVYESGPIRWAGAVAFAGLGALAVKKLSLRAREPQT